MNQPRRDVLFVTRFRGLPGRKALTKGLLPCKMIAIALEHCANSRTSFFSCGGGKRGRQRAEE
jgi:hypothetical protein